MKFSYDNLRLMERSGDRVGNWKGLPVFASCKARVYEYGSGAFLIIYDDENRIIKCDNGTWYCYGEVSESGQVTEWDYKKKYLIYFHDTQMYEPAPTHAVCSKNSAECDGTAAAAADEVVGDVKIGLDIDALLSSVRTMTVDSLLEGFDYGLEAKG